MTNQWVNGTATVSGKATLNAQIPAAIADRNNLPDNPLQHAPDCVCLCRAAWAQTATAGFYPSEGSTAYEIFTTYGDAQPLWPIMATTVAALI